MPKLFRLLLSCLLLASGALATERARNVILFLGDAGGIPTLHAASLHGHGRPLSLFIQTLPHIGLMDTSAVDRWVTDSAAGMTAIVTGQKTNAEVLSQAADAVAGKVDGTPLRTILEHAEEHGLATGVITNMSIADATPAACYAHANHRKKTGEIFAQVATPRYGDGVDIIIGAGKNSVLAATRERGVDIEALLRDRGYTIFASPAEMTDVPDRALALSSGDDFDPLPVVARAIRILGRNPRGYFLMVEWDMHTNKLERGLNRALKMDDLVRQTASQVGDDTLIIFTADHSFDLRVRGGKPGEPLLPPAQPAGTADAEVRAASNLSGDQVVAPKPDPGMEPTPGLNVRVDDSHTGEEVLVAARGPGAERVHGFIANTDLFHIMMTAFGWETPPAAP